MKELSVFIDESGDFGEYDDQAPYDNAESYLPFTFCDVAIYAHDGSICGYRLIEPVG